MEKDRTSRIIAVIAVCVALVGTTIGFAAFSTSLKIQGTADVKASKWEIKFANLQTVALTGSAVEVAAPTINTGDTTISNYSVNLVKPGDTATYTFDVTNTGTFDSKISSINIPTPTCTGNGANAEADAANVCSNVTYELTYADGPSVSKNDTLTAGQTKTMKLKLSYSSSVAVDKLPADDVRLSDLGISIIYSQN